MEENADLILDRARQRVRKYLWEHVHTASEAICDVSAAQVVRIVREEQQKQNDGGEHAMGESFDLWAERRRAEPGDSRHELVTGRGAYEFVKGGIRFTTTNGESQTFLYNDWRIEIRDSNDGSSQ